MIETFSLNNSVDWNSITGKPTTFPSDWNTMINTPTAFPPLPHTHHLADIVDLNTLTVNWSQVVGTPSTFPSDWNTMINKPAGTLGDVLVNNGTDWQANNIIEYYPLSWFKTNQTLVLPKNKIVALQGTTFHKMADGVSQLGQLQWRNSGINLNGQSISIGGELYYRYDSSVNNYLASNAKKQSIITSVQTFPIDANILRGQYIILKQPSTINYVGINIVSVSGAFSSQFIFLIYSVDFGTQSTTLLTHSSPITVTTAGYYRNTTPFNLDLEPSVYMIAYANVMSSGSGTIQAIYTENTEFQQHRLNSESFPQYLQTNTAVVFPSVILTSPPTTAGLSGVVNSQTSTLMYYWFNPIN
jgi:hypothetical protein